MTRMNQAANESMTIEISWVTNEPLKCSSVFDPIRDLIASILLIPTKIAIPAMVIIPLLLPFSIGIQMLVEITTLMKRNR